jgi:DegV family protein with EDD domain
MGRRVRLITDSVADIPPLLIRQFGIEVIPIYLTVGDKTYREDHTLGSDWFYRELSRRNGDLTTAAPPPQDFLRAYTTLANEGAEAIIGIFTAGSVSSIMDHALVAARVCDQAQVFVIDSQQVSMGTGWLVIHAAELLRNGLPVAEVLSALHTMRERTLVLGVLNSLDHLQRSGRIGRFTRHMADLMKIKPLIAFERGEARLIARVRTYWRAIEHMVARVDEQQPLARLALLHSRAEDEVIARLHDSLLAFVGQQELPVIDVGAVFATHIGPGGLGVAIVREPGAED